jgi:hypothetical protein
MHMRKFHAMTVPSREQADIVEHVLQGMSICVEAVAGAGKTASVLMVVKAMVMAASPSSAPPRVLQLTYNSQLKMEVRRKCQAEGLSSYLDVHTFHSLMLRNYGPQGGYDDSALRKALDSKQPLQTPVPCYSLVVVDEAQDMTRLYFDFMTRLLKTCSHTPQFLVLGDRHQTLYGFKGADARYLTLAPELYTQHWPQTQWIRSTLSCSYRVPSSIARYINVCLLGTRRIRTRDDGTETANDHMNNATDEKTTGDKAPLTDDAAKDAIKDAIANGTMKEAYKVSSQGVELLIGCSPRNMARCVAQRLLQLMQQDNVQAQDIFVLCGSLKSVVLPVKLLEHELVAAKVPVFFPSHDHGALDEMLLRNKVVFSTFHQAKGRERPVVVVYGWDEGYFRSFVREGPWRTCPCALYVAATRAQQRLFLVQMEAPLPCLQQSHEKAVDEGILLSCTQVPTLVPDSGPIVRTVPGTNVRPSHVAVTELTRYLSETAQSALLALVDPLFDQVRPPVFTDPHHPPATIEGHVGRECVADLTGLAITNMFESTVRTPTSQQVYLQGFLTPNVGSDRPRACHPLLRRALSRACGELRTPSDHLYLANVYTAATCQVLCRLTQLSRFNWLSANTAAKLLHVLSTTILGSKLDRKTLANEALLQGKGVTGHIGHMFGNVDAVNVTNEGVDDKSNTSSNAILFEKTVSWQRSGTQILGRVDVVHPGANMAWEVKCCTGPMELEHKLQVILYATLWQQRQMSQTKLGDRHETPVRFGLLNVLTGETLYLKDVLREEGVRIVDLLLHFKWHAAPATTDATFIQDHKPSAESLGV